MDSLSSIFGQSGVFQPAAPTAQADPNNRPSLDAIFNGTAAQGPQTPAQMVAANPAQHVFNPNVSGNKFTTPTPAGATQMQYAPGQGTSVASHLLSGTRSAVWDLTGKPFVQTGVSGYNAVQAAKDLAVNGGKPSVQATQDLNQPRNLPGILGGTTAPLSTEHPFAAGAQAGADMAGTVMGAADLAEKGLGAAKSAIEGLAATRDAKTLNAIQETISPKITSKETQAIINEGRLTRGNDSMLFGKKPDIVTQSENVQQSANIIHDQIPNAAKMNDAQLSNAINSRITETSQALKPQMQATPVHPDTTAKVQDTWSSLKTEQQARPEFLDNKAGNAAFQGKFENYLKQMNGAKNMDDVWQIRQAYDSSVPANVKNATSASPPQFQVRKAMWLENRAILNSAINDTATGLGSTSQQAFSDMSHMYDARENIAAKAKIDTTGTPGPLSKSTVIKWGLGAGATLFGLHKLGL